MPNYAQLDSDTVTNVVVAEADYAAEQGWVEVPADQPVGIGWTYDGTNWTAPPLPAATQSPLASDLTAAANWGSLTATQQGAIITDILRHLGA